MVPPNLLPATERIQLWQGIQKGQAAEIGRVWLVFARIAYKNWVIKMGFVLRLARELERSFWFKVTEKRQKRFILHTYKIVKRLTFTTVAEKEVYAGLR